MTDDTHYVRPIDCLSPGRREVIAERYAAVFGRRAHRFAGVFDQVFFAMEASLGDLPWEDKVEAVASWWEGKLGLSGKSWTSPW
jgi:hypothetical protein